MSRKPNIKMTTWRSSRASRIVTSFLARPATEPAAETTARRILDRIRKEGDKAVIAFVKRYDGATLTSARLKVGRKELEAARRTVNREFKQATRAAHKRIETFSKAGLRDDWRIRTPKGGQLGETYAPYERVGCYIPGGASPLASTALMTVTLAKVAGVPEIVACTPADKSGKVNPHILFALELAGVTEIYKVGGIQSIGAMAYGTKTVPKVQKIVGPGGPYVTAAKRLVYGEVDLDMIAGPSEIAILADDSVKPEFVAADLLSQAEHGTGLEKSLLVTTSAKMIEAVKNELLSQAAALPRRDIVYEVLGKGTLLVQVDTLDEGMNLINRFAPEHFELLVKEPAKWAKKARTAGAVFLGPWTPEAAGDFAAGPSHVLPTGGAAALFSGLSVDTFRRRSSLVSLTRADLKELLPIIEEFSRVEELEAHARSARIRFEPPSRS